MAKYNTQIEINNTDLQTILNTINNLPDGGSGGLDTSDATALAAEIFKDKTAYIASGKVTGTFTLDNELNSQNDLMTQLETILASKAVGIVPKLQEKSITPTTKTQEIICDNGYDGLSKVTVNPIPSDYIQPKGSLNITANGTYDIKQYEFVDVAVGTSETWEITLEDGAVLQKVVMIL